MGRKNDCKSFIGASFICLFDLLFNGETLKAKCILIQKKITQLKDKVIKLIASYAFISNNRLWIWFAMKNWHSLMLLCSYYKLLSKLKFIQIQGKTRNKPGYDNLFVIWRLMWSNLIIIM